jgi:hypothetical protein
MHIHREGLGGLSGPELTVMTEGELAAMRAEEGMTVVQRVGRYWEAIFPGFYQPVHLLGRFRPSEVKRPAFFCWGYRAALYEDDANLANGSVPVHLMTNVKQFTEATLSRNRRGDLRRCRQHVEFRRLQDPSLLVEQGYEVFMSARRRVDYYFPHLTEAEYRKRMERRAKDERRLILAGLVDGKLGGYLESYAVDDTLYAHELVVATEVVRTGIGTGLYVETIETGVRAESIRDVCLGLHTPEREGITTFKEGLGFPIVNVPARSAIPAPIGAYIKARRPAVHYRLTGVRPGAIAKTLE